jgi:hypothetical protein
MLPTENTVSHKQNRVISTTQVRKLTGLINATFAGNIINYSRLNAETSELFNTRSLFTVDTNMLQTTLKKMKLV